MPLRSYLSPLRFAPVPPPARRSTLVPRYTFGPKPKRRTEMGLLVFGSLLIVALYVIAALGQKSKIPDNIGPFLGVVLGLALVAHMANRWLVPNANAVILPLAALLNGIGYVIIARWNPPYRAPTGRVDRAGRGPVRAHAPGRPLFTRPRALPLPAAAAGRHPARATAVLHPHRRGQAVGPRGRSLLPADRVLQDPALHLLRVVLRREQGAALDPDGADRQPALPRPPAPAAHPGGVGGRHGRHRPRGRHRLRRPPLRPLHRVALGRHRPGGLPDARPGALRRRVPSSRPTTSARSTCGSSSG